MKKGVLISFLLFTNLAIAGDIPDCWDRPDEVKDGSLIIGISVKDVTKRQLIRILDLANGKHIVPPGYPLIFDDSIYIEVEAVDYGVGEHRLSREELKQAVREELMPIAAIKGVSLSCNNIVRPAPGVVPIPR